jgi:hypothetical protein
MAPQPVTDLLGLGGLHSSVLCISSLLHIFIYVDWFLLQEENDFKNYLKMHLKY